MTGEARREFRSDRRVVVTFAVLGAVCVVVAIATLALPDRLLAFLLMTLPLGIVGMWLLSRVPGLARARVVTDDTGLFIDIQTWADGLLRSGQPVHLSWSEIQRLTHTRREYGRGSGLPTVVDEYTIVTATASYTLTKNIVPHPDRVLAHIAARTGLTVDEVP